MNRMNMEFRGPIPCEYCESKIQDNLNHPQTAATTLSLVYLSQKSSNVYEKN